MAGNSVNFPGSYATLGTYAVSVSNVVNLGGATAVNGNLGLSFISGLTQSGSSIINGSINTSDFGDSFSYGSAMLEMQSLYNDISGFTGAVLSNIGNGSNFTAGTYKSTGPITVNGTITLTGTPTDQFFFIADNFLFGATTTVNIALIGVESYNVFWVCPNGIIISGSSTINGILLTEGGDITALDSGATVTGAVYSVSGSTELVDALINLPPYPAPPCYLAGTKILTLIGYMEVEKLKAGYNIVTKGYLDENNTYVEDDTTKQCPVSWIIKRIVKKPTSESFPIRIVKNALENGPSEDLYVSPDHKILVNGKPILAKNLLNGTTIIQDTRTRGIVYYHIKLDKHYCIFANGVLAESFYGE
jgi:hypothetical protein